MSNIKVIEGKTYKIQVVDAEEQHNIISESDAEMDARAVQAVKAAIEKAEFCKKPIALYDQEEKKAYIQYPDGRREYVK